MSGDVIRGDIDKLEFSVKSDDLHITRKSGSRFLGSDNQFKVYVTLPALEAVSASSGATFSMNTLETNDFSADVSSGATMKIDQTTALDVSLESSSGSILRVAGTCLEISADVSSGSTLDAQKLEC